MRLLVSVNDHHEAAAALAGGADIIDAKDPASGPLGAVSVQTLREICSVSRDAYLVTAALGDADDERVIEDKARAYAQAGAALVKVGFGGITDLEHVVLLLAAAVRGVAAVDCRHHGVVAVAYVDGGVVASVTPCELTPAAVKAGAIGVLLDTANKQGPGLRDLLPPLALASWIAEAHDAGLLVAVAGRLREHDLSTVRDAGADIAGVRGAACEGGRTGRVTTERVRGLLACLGPASPPGTATRRTPTGCSCPREVPEGRVRPSTP